ncbi:DUF5994 family protein [Nocardioides nitrophenolicus]|uniref:DUF5994 family protein n=1 Tax=Nocardioides nitrophenolicus TaxID=60489 RepID=UPI001957344A|nr:DUF5994 family protein [Nocardioides nitrophenolicus]MBM7516170.1 hypothetical protein [Nocardioides nitrophenolicus]
MSAPEFRYPHRHPDALGLLRLRLTDGHDPSLADGLWLPYGRDLAREGAHLVDEFPVERGRVDRLAYAPGDWEAGATAIFTRYGRVKAGSLPEERGRGLVLLRLHTCEVLRIRIAWPGSGRAPG